jgi:hypothetical protein
MMRWPNHAARMSAVAVADLGRRAELADEARAHHRFVRTGRNRRYPRPHDRRTAGAIAPTAGLFENHPGAGRHLGAGLVARAEPDGYALLMSGSPTHSVGPHLFKRLAYEPMCDVPPVAMVATAPNLLVTKSSLPVRSLDDLVRLALRNDLLVGGQRNVGTSRRRAVEKRGLDRHAPRAIQERAGSGHRRAVRRRHSFFSRSPPYCRRWSLLVTLRSALSPDCQHGSHDRRSEEQSNQAECLETAEDAEENPQERQTSRDADQRRRDKMIGNENDGRREAAVPRDHVYERRSEWNRCEQPGRKPEQNGMAIARHHIGDSEQRSLRQSD